MGMHPKSCSVYPGACKVVAPNPDPARFEIEMTEQVGRNVVALIKYPDCTNFEGSKICVFLSTTVLVVRSKVRLDPHFSETGFSPFARFAPTEQGWHAAICAARTEKGGGKQ
jgi:hypothetical protein